MKKIFLERGKAAVVDGGNGVDLGNSLEKHRPRILLFIGHADAKHRYTRELTLGLTDEKGGIVRLNVDTLVDTFVAANLDLVVINGCESEALGAKIAARGGIPVVCWRTKAARRGGGALLAGPLRAPAIPAAPIASHPSGSLS